MSGLPGVESRQVLRFARPTIIPAVEQVRQPRHFSTQDKKMKSLNKKLPYRAALVAFIVIILGAFGPMIFLFGELVYLNSIETTEFKVDGAIVRMNGVINGKTYDQFMELHKRNPQITTLHEENVPGSVDDDTMIKLGYYIRAQRLNTMLGCNSEIHSGGVDLFAAGVERTIDCADAATTPDIGVHSWGGAGTNASDFPKDAPEHEQNRKYIEDMLGDDAFYWFTIYAADADDIHIMSRAEIDKYGLVTRWEGKR